MIVEDVGISLVLENIDKMFQSRSRESGGVIGEPRRETRWGLRRWWYRFDCVRNGYDDGFSIQSSRVVLSATVGGPEDAHCRGV